MLFRVVNTEGAMGDVRGDGVSDQNAAEEQANNDADTGCFLSDGFFIPRGE